MSDSYLLSPHINLPFPILLHSIGLVSLGVFLLIQTRASSSYHRPRRPETAHPTSMLGLTTLGLGLGYLLTSYTPVGQNQFLHASVPVRISLGIAAAIKYPYAAREERAALAITAMYDGFGGAFLGWWLGRWDGRVTG